MSNSYQRVLSDGTTVLLDISIDYLDRDEITVYFDDVLTTAWIWSGTSDKRILFPSPVPNGVVVMVKRTTDASKLRHAFSEGAKFTAPNLDEDLKQALHMAQEASEANLVGDFFTDINLHGYRLYNVGPAIDDTDALTLGQARADSTTAVAAAETATAAAAAATAAAASLDIGNPNDVTKGDALLAVKQPYTGATSRTQHDKNKEVFSLRDFGAVGDGVTVDTAAVTACEAAAQLAGISDVYLPPGTYLVASGYAFTKQYFGPGVFSYFGIGPVTFTGAGLNDIFVEGSYRGMGSVSVIVEVTGSTSPNTFRFSPDGGTTWVSQTVTILPDDSEVITPLTMTTSAQALGQTGVTLRWGAITGHTVGDRWTFTLRQNPKVLEAGTGVSMRGQLILFADGNRNLTAGQGSGSTSHLSFEQVNYGNDCGQSNISGYGCVNVGNRAGQLSKTGFLRTCIGTWAGRDGNGNGDTYIGAYAGINAPGGVGGYNTGVGNDAGSFLWNGTENTLIGAQAGHGNDESRTGWNPIRNTLGGVQTMRDIENAAYCSVWGAFSAPIAKSVSGLTSVGYASFGGLTTGNNNSGLGVQAGSSVTTGSTNLFLGYFAGNNALQKVDVTNSICIGPNTFSTANNQIIIGNSANTAAYFYGNILPQTDNAQSLGASGARFSVVWAGTGTISTSDMTMKSNFRAITDVELAVAEELIDAIEVFQFNDAVAKKGEAGARYHVGLGAQIVRDTFIRYGLDPERYAMFCHDVWEPEVIEIPSQILGENGKPLGTTRIVHKEGGSRYGLRYDQLTLFCLKALARRK